MKLLAGAIDLHVHSHPDVRPRRLDDLELVKAARDAGMRALLLKSHVFSTVERAYLLNQMVPEVRSFGGLVLNETVGGLNERAVEAALDLGAAKIWMPTLSAANHTKQLGGDGSVTVLSGSSLRPVVRRILERIRARDAAVGTGHLSPDETTVLVDEAASMGLRKIVVTHPEWRVTAIPVEQQQCWAATGHVYFERCLVSTEASITGHVSFKTIVDQIESVGVASTVIATDYGLDRFPSPVEGLKTYLRRLRNAGFTEAELSRMVRENPATLLGLDAAPNPRPAQASGAGDAANTLPSPVN